MTQQFLAAPLFQELQRFANGVAFQDTSPAFQTAVVRLHFIPVVETTIESKHAVSTRLHKRDTHAGPIMVSLHNRMVILERRLEHEPGFLTKLATQMDCTRRLGAVPLKLGLRRHPLLVELENAKGRRAVSSHLQKPLTAVIYRTDLEGQYKPLASARKQRDNFQKKFQRTVQQALQDLDMGDKSLALKDKVRHGLILDHFRAVSSSSDGRAMVFSLPGSSAASIQRLSDFFARPEGRQSSGSAGVLQDFAEGSADNLAVSMPVFFTVTKSKPSANHHLYVHPGAGPSLKSKHVAVALHSSSPVVNAPAHQFSVTCQDFGVRSSSDNLALLSTCVGQPQDLEVGLQAWSVDSKLEYSVPDGSPEVRGLLSHMIANNYFVEEGDFYVPQAAWREAAEQLAGQDIVQPNDMGGFAVTKSILSKLTLHWTVQSPQPVCAVRTSLAIENLTGYELLLKLESEGFSWRPWPTSTKQRQLALPYAPGREKVWYSTRAPPPIAYFQALLTARDIVQAGVHGEIPHGRDRKVYEAIVAGEELELRARNRKRPALMDADGELPQPVADAAKPAKARRRQRRGPGSVGDLALPLPSHAEETGVSDHGGQDEVHAELEFEPSGVSGDSDGHSSLNDEILDLLAEGDAGHDSPEFDGPVESEQAGLHDARADTLDGKPVPAPAPDVALPAPAAGSRRPANDRTAPARVDGLHAVQRMLSSSRWGVFRLTPKQPGSKGGGLYGGFEGTCCFHKKNDVTGCKKYVSIKGPEEADRDKAFRQVLFWCSQAKDVARQREHLKVSLGPVPLIPVLLARKIAEAPTEEVKSDVQLDAEEAAAARGRGRGAGLLRNVGPRPNPNLHLGLHPCQMKQLLIPLAVLRAQAAVAAPQVKNLVLFTKTPVLMQACALPVLSLRAR